jgi:hypothetical protein
MRLDRLSRSGRHLGRKRADFRGLGRERVKPLSPIGRLQFHDLGEVLGADCIAFSQWVLLRLDLRWQGFRKGHGQVCKRLKRENINDGKEFYEFGDGRTAASGPQSRRHVAEADDV